LDSNVTAADLDAVFSQFGTIFSSKIAMDDDNKSRGYGYL